MSDGLVIYGGPLDGDQFQPETSPVVEVGIRSAADTSPARTFTLGGEVIRCCEFAAPDPEAGDTVHLYVRSIDGHYEYLGVR